MNDSIDLTRVSCMKHTERCVRKELFTSVDSLHWECFFSPPPQISSVHVLLSARKSTVLYHEASQESSVGIAMGYGLDGRASIPGSSRRSFSTPQSPDWLSGPPSLPLNGYWGLFSRGKVVGEWSWPLFSIYCQNQEFWSYTFNLSCLHGVVLN
jgi:hypothetical protein